MMNVEKDDDRSSSMKIAKGTMSQYFEIIYRVLRTIHSLTIFGCAATEIAKIIYFTKAGYELDTNNADDIGYLFIVFLNCFVEGVLLVGPMSKAINAIEERGYLTILSALLVWTNVAIFSKSTVDQMGAIPFFCPNNYPYLSPKVREACIVGKISLGFAWAYAGFFVIILLRLCIHRLHRRDKQKNNWG